MTAPQLAKSLLVLVVIANCSGCASEPFARVGLHQKTSWDTSRQLYDTGRDPIFKGEVGLEWKNGVSCSYTHVSHLRDGKPFNNRPEFWLGTVGCDIQFGGY